MDNRRRADAVLTARARVAELVDALASGASARMGVEVQVLSRVPNKEDLRGLFCLVSSGIFLHPLIIK